MEEFSSILGGLLDVIDDEDFDRLFGRFKFQPQLLLERGEDRGTGWVDCGSRSRDALRRVGIPLEMQIKSCGEPCLVDDESVEAGS
jgi:hypothetical protein